MAEKRNPPRARRRASENTVLWRDGSEDSKPLVASQRVWHLAARIHATGPRPLGELLLEIIAANPALLARIERYAALDPGIVHALGCDRIPRILHGLLS